LYRYVRGNPVNWNDPLGWAGPPPGVPYPPANIPGGPWEWSANDQNSRKGDFIGPKQPKGPRQRCTYAPPEEGQDPYWKTTDPEGNQQRYDQNGNPITPEEAHPGSGGGELEGGWERVQQLLFNRRRTIDPHCTRPEPRCSVTPTTDSSQQLRMLNNL
jgi:hypothetical protein